MLNEYIFLCPKYDILVFAENVLMKKLKLVLSSSPRATLKGRLYLEECMRVILCQVAVS